MSSKSQTFIVSERGQLTLPKVMRKRLGINPGTALVGEEDYGKLTLRPAAVTPVEIYSNEEIAGWLVEDRIGDKERKRVHEKAGLG